MANQVKIYKRDGVIPPLDIAPNIRGEDLFYHILMFFHRPATWPRWIVIAGLIFWISAMAGLWQLISPRLGVVTGLGLFVFAVTDWLLLAWLPKARLSFGPVIPQLIMMMVPRSLVVLGAAGLAHVGHIGWGLAAFFGLELFGTLSHVWGLVFEPQRLTISEFSVTSPHFSAGTRPIRMLHLTDFHIERLTAREERVLRLVTELQPDLIVMSGDYLNVSYRRDPEAIEQVRHFLSQLEAPYGVYAVLGTPSVDLPDIAPLHFADTDIHLLRRDVVEVDLGDGRKLALLGLDCTHDPIYDGHLLGRLAELAPGDAPRILLYHSPELMPVAPENDIDLYLCGHTHGGQIRLPGYGALFTSAATGKRYEMGRYHEDGTTLYVSRGIGLEGWSLPRLRLSCPPEIALVTVTAEP